MRVLDFDDGFTSSTAPTGGSATVVTGTPGAPTAITAAGGITPSGVADETIYIQGSGGAVNITANPQIAAGTIGQRLRLVGCSDTNTVTLEDGTGIKMNVQRVLGLNSTIDFEHDGTVWQEVGQNDI